MKEQKKTQSRRPDWQTAGLFMVLAILTILLIYGLKFLTTTQPYVDTATR